MATLCRTYGASHVESWLKGENVTPSEPISFKLGYKVKLQSNR